MLSVVLLSDLTECYTVLEKNEKTGFQSILCLIKDNLLFLKAINYYLSHLIKSSSLTHGNRLTLSSTRPRNLDFAAAAPAEWKRQSLEKQIYKIKSCCFAGIPSRPKFLPKLLYIARFSRYEHFVFCNFWEKFENLNWPPFLVRQNFFLKIGMATLQRYPVGQKFHPNRSI